MVVDLFDHIQQQFSTEQMKQIQRGWHSWSNLVTS